MVSVSVEVFPELVTSGSIRGQFGTLDPLKVLLSEFSIIIELLTGIGDDALLESSLRDAILDTDGVRELPFFSEGVPILLVIALSEEFDRMRDDAGLPTRHIYPAGDHGTSW